MIESAEDTVGPEARGAGRIPRGVLRLHGGELVGGCGVG